MRGGGSKNKSCPNELKKKILDTSCLCQAFFFSAHLDNKQKSFVPKKICGLLLFETLKIKKSDFLNSNTTLRYTHLKEKLLKTI